MSKFKLYNINLKNIENETLVLEFDLDNEYFKKIDSPEVQKGNVKAKVSVSKRNNTFDLVFNLEGIISIACDRCLDDMEQAIHYKEKLQVKFGATFSEENEIVIVPEAEGAINIAWFLYEFIVLNIPIKHVHAPGECNKMMVTKLKRHITRNKDDGDSEDNTFEFDDDTDASPDTSPTDSRWDGLQSLMENDNN